MPLPSRAGRVLRDACAGLGQEVRHPLRVAERRADAARSARTAVQQTRS